MRHRRFLGVALSLLMLILAGCSRGGSAEPPPPDGEKNGLNPVPGRISRTEPAAPGAVPAPVRGKGSVWVDGEANPGGVWEPFYIWTGGSGTCSVGTALRSTPEWQREYPCPENMGQLTIYHIDPSGTVVAFLTARGGTGTFDLVSHAWTFSDSATPAGLYPADTRTSIQSVDRFLQAVMDRVSGHPETFVKLAEYPCSKEEGNSGLPLCGPDEPEKTPVRAFVRAACNVQFIQDEALARELTRQWFLPRPLWLHSAYALEPTPITGMATYALVLAGHPADNQSLTAYLNGDGGLVELKGHCGPPGVPFPGAQALLPPK